MKHLLPFITLIALVLILHSALTQVLHYFMQRRLLDAGPLDDNGLRLLENLNNRRDTSLKWALILFSGGCGLLAIGFMPDIDPDSPIPYGIEAVFVAAGLLTHFLLTGQRR